MAQQKNNINISSWLDDPSFSDCTVVSRDGHEFQLHRNVLGQSSDVFKAMLTSDMQEGATKVIKLTEHFKSLDNLFNLMYKEVFAAGLKEVMDLAVVTKKYLLAELHEKCMMKLKELIQLSNAVKILIFAQENDHRQLQNAALNFIGENFERIRKSTSWNLLEEDTEALVKCVDAYIDHNAKLKQSAPKAKKARVHGLPQGHVLGTGAESQVAQGVHLFTPPARR